jgi:hypothetical protein
MGQIPFWGANIRSVAPEIPQPLRKPKVHDHVLKNPPLVFILSHMNSLHTLIPYLFRFNFKILSFKLRFPR